MKKISAIVCLIFFVHFSYGNNDLIISKWLITEPLNTLYPAFHDTKNVDGEKFSNRELLVFEHTCLGDIQPSEGEIFGWISGQTSKWTEKPVDEKGFLNFEANDPAIYPQMAFIAVYLKADRWTEANLVIKTPHMAQVYLNGKALGKKTTVEQEQSTLGKITQSLKLKKGKHLLLIKSLYTPGNTLNWKINAILKPGEGFRIADLDIDTKPYRTKTINDILNGIKVSWVKPSPSGELYAVAYREAKPPEGDQENWIEIKNRNDKSLVHSFRHASISGLQWLPKSRAVSYITRDNNKSTLHILDFEKGKTLTLLEEVERMGNYRWSKDENFIIYSVTEDNKDDPDHIKHVLYDPGHPYYLP